MQPAISLLEKTPRLLETMLGDLSGELLYWKPAPDRWSISEVFSHLAALEEVYAERTMRMVAEDSPGHARYDLEGAISRGEYSRGSAGENLALFTSTHRSTLALLVGFRLQPAVAREYIRNLEPSPWHTCSMNGPITISGPSGKSQSSTGHTPSILIPDRS